MHIVKMLGLILLGIYLILTGVVTITEATLGMVGRDVIALMALASGVLILVSMGKCVCHKEGKE